MRIYLILLLTLLQAFQPGVSFAQQAKDKIVEGTSFPGLNAPRNFVQNPDLEKPLGTTITATGGTTARSSSSPIERKYSVTFDTTVAGTILKIKMDTFDGYLKNGNCAASFWYSGATAGNYKAYVTINSVKVSSDFILSNTTDPKSISPSDLTYNCGSLVNAAEIWIESVAALTTQIKADRFYGGEFTGVGTAAVPFFAGSAAIAATTSCTWSTSSTSIAAFSTVSACPGPTVELAGDGPEAIQTTDTDLPKFTVNNLRAGSCKVSMTFSSGGFPSHAGFAIYDGTDTRGNSASYTDISNNVESNTVTAWFKYTTAGNKTFELYGSAGSNSISILNNGDRRKLSFEISCLPITSQTSIQMGQIRTPTITRLTSGTSQTYTVPIGVTQLKVRMVGGGGGSAGSGGSGAGGAGGTGGTTTFIQGATTLLSATGGGGGATSGGSNTVAAGGTGTITTPAYGSTYTGGSGNGAGYSASTGTYWMGGSGGNSFLGGGGGATSQSLAGPGAPNTGGGAGGPGNNTSNSTWGGAGGGGGGGIEAIIPGPLAATYTYSVGSGGTAGAAGVHPGGLGGSGVIEITEIYGWNLPLVNMGVVARDNATGTTTVNTVVSKSADYTATTDEETIRMDSSGANRTISLPPAASFKGKRYILQGTSASNRVIIDPNASETICGQTTVSLVGAEDAMEIYSDGTNWKSIRDCEKPIRVFVATPCTVNGVCALASSTGGATVQRTATGSYQVNPPTGSFSGGFNCNYTCGPTTTGNCFARTGNSVSATLAYANTYNSASGALIDEGFSALCSGPR